MGQCIHWRTSAYGRNMLLEWQHGFPRGTSYIAGYTEIRFAFAAVVFLQLPVQQARVRV